MAATVTTHEHRVEALCRDFGIEYRRPDKIRLNDKFKVGLRLEAPDPAIKYLAIGNGGHQKNLVDGANVTITAVPRVPEAYALYNHIPWIIRPVTEDLPEATRDLYRMRVIEIYDGVTYACYYLRKLDIADNYPITERRSYTGLTQTTSKENITLSALHPSPPITGYPLKEDVSVNVSLKVDFDLTQNDIDEIKEAAAIMNGGPGYGIISEIGMVSGDDVVTEGNFNGINKLYIEAAEATLKLSANVNLRLEIDNPVGTYTIDVGSAEGYVRS